MTRMIDWLKVSGTTLGTSLLMVAPALAQQGPGPGPGQGGGQGWGYGHPMMGWGGGRFGGGGGWMVAHGVFHLLVLVALIAIVLACVRYLRHGCRFHHRHGTGVGLEILETRYAKGEIGRDEYLEKKRDLGGRA